jgi:hypothetical protein
MKLLTIFAILLLPALGVAQGTSSGEANLKFLFPARILSMAGAPVADPENAMASFINPACLASGNSVQVMFSQLQWIQDIQTQLLSTSLPLTLGTASFALSSTSVANIPIREVPGPELGSFSSHSTVFQVGYALDLLPELSVGTTAKYLYDKLYIDDASGYAFDLGALYRAPLEGLSLGAAITNIGWMNPFRAQKTDLPTKVDLGANYTFSNGDFNFVSAIALGQETATGGTQELRLGGEVSYDKLLSIRVGYQTGYDIRRLSAGLGIHYSIIQFDYAYIPFSEGFGNANILTVGMKF